MYLDIRQCKKNETLRMRKCHCSLENVLCYLFWLNMSLFILGKNKGIFTLGDYFCMFSKVKGRTVDVFCLSRRRL